MTAWLLATAGHGLALGLAACLLIPNTRRQLRPAALCLALAVPFVPVGGVALGAYSLGIVGPLSLGSLSLIVLGVVSQMSGRVQVERRDWQTSFGLAVLAGLLLYPAAFGLTELDPYRLGYRPGWFAVAVAATAVLCWLTRRPWTAWTLVVATAAFQAGLVTSTNYWDALVDPLLFLAALGYAAVTAACWAHRRMRRPRPPRP